jgi:hypothetical protein
LHDVPEKRVSHVDSILCTLAEVQAASDHAADHCAGAPVEKRHLSGWTRMMDVKKDETATFPRSKGVVWRSDGGAPTAKQGVKWL